LFDRHGRIVREFYDDMSRIRCFFQRREQQYLRFDDRSLPLRLAGAVFSNGTRAASSIQIKS
jgi:hypothetical protein